MSSQGESAPSGELEAEVIHKDGTTEPVHPMKTFVSWLKGLFSDA